jgi:hypothetical protein
MNLNIVSFKIAVLAFAWPLLAHADGGADHELELARKTAQQWTWGLPTNGIVGGVYATAGPEAPKTEYRIYVHEQFELLAGSFPPTFYSEPNGNGIAQGWFLKKSGDTNWGGMYFKATNYFCGPVILRDSNGVEVPPRDRNLVSDATYPPSFRHLELGSLDDLHRKIASPLFGRLPQLARFKLEDIFEMKKSGDYVLTVWPKIYRQLKNDDDLCERIDVPPISVKVRWISSP